jgi:hypothetical protein
MANLEVLNVWKCLKLLQEFLDAVQVDSSDADLIELKERAEFALDQLQQIFSGKPGPVAGGVIPCSKRARSC